MRRRILFSILVAITLCAFLTGDEKRAASAIVTSFYGTVTMEREGKGIVLDAMIELYEGDRIEVGADGNVVILYPSGKFRSLGSGSTVIIEPLRSDGIEANGSSAGNESGEKSFEPLFAFKAAAERLEGRKGVRATDTTGIFIFSPGNSSILDPEPGFVWSLVAEAEEYTIEIQRMGKAVGTTQVQDTFLSYPVDWQRLEPEKSYVVKVEALKDGKAIQSKIVRFKILPPETRALVEGGRDAIMESAPDTVTAFLLLSELYKEHKLYGLAIDVLRMLTIKTPEIPEFHRSLSELYKSYGLTRESNQELERYENLLKGH
jgi:hypothetical protein